MNNNLAGENMQEGKRVQDNSATTTAAVTIRIYQQPCRRYPEHTTAGTLTTSSTSYKWSTIDNSNGNNNNNNNNRKTYNNSTKSLPISAASSNAEIKRQRRIVRYKSYAVEGQMKESIKNGLRWVKNKYCQLVHGY